MVFLLEELFPLSIGDVLLVGIYGGLYTRFSTWHAVLPPLVGCDAVLRVYRLEFIWIYMWGDIFYYVCSAYYMGRVLGGNGSGFIEIWVGFYCDKGRVLFI